MRVDPKQLSRAERLLWSYGVTDPGHIDLVAIANDHNAKVVRRPLEGCEARIVASGDRAVISINSSSYEGRQRFSLAHELAHWICDRETGSFLCAKEEIGPQNAEAKSVEAKANSFASQLILPDYLALPWIDGKRATLDVASAMAKAFNASLTAAAIKLVKKAVSPACVTCHSQSKLIWFQRNGAFPAEFFIVRELHQDTDAFAIAFGASSGISSLKRESGDRWLSGRDTYRLIVQSQSIRLPDGTVLSLLSILS
jgi:Zn-dependent peptidase ImmA (M78 family)